MFFAAVLQRTTALIESKTAEGSSAGVLAHFRCDVGGNVTSNPGQCDFCSILPERISEICCDSE